MTVVDENLTLTSPEPGWGAVKRNLELTDFTHAIQVFAVAAILFGIEHEQLVLF